MGRSPPHVSREVRITHSRVSSDSVPYVPFHARSLHPSIPGMCMRTSTRWFDVNASNRAFTPVPFVTISGHLSGSTLCFWTAYPQQIVASLTATVYQRLLRLVAKRHGHKFAGSCKLTLFKVSAYYATVHDDGFLNRILGILKKRNRRAAHNLYTFAYCNLDEDKRFVINQSCQQFLWLSFRSRAVNQQRCRDKSSMKDFTSPRPLR